MTKAELPPADEATLLAELCGSAENDRRPIDIPSARQGIAIALAFVSRHLAGEGEGRADWVAAAADYTLETADAPPPARSEHGSTVHHASWMLHEIANGKIAGRKAHRWLGYAQGILVIAEWLTLDEAKEANKRASDEAPPTPAAKLPPREPISGPALNALRAYQQADEEGIMVLVSRQALDEAIAALSDPKTGDGA